MATLDSIYAQMLGVMPAGDAVRDDPAFAASPYVPPWQGADMGLPFPAAFPAEPPPESAQPDPLLGVTPAFGATTTAQDIYGYSPQPRPPLPESITADAAGLYGPFRGVWEGLQEEPDPLAALLAGPQPEPVVDPRVPELPWEPAEPFLPQPPSRGERALRGQGYGRVMDRVNWLRSLRAQRGY